MSKYGEKIERRLVLSEIVLIVSIILTYLSVKFSWGEVGAVSLIAVVFSLAYFFIYACRKHDWKLLEDFYDDDDENPDNLPSGF